MFDYYFKEQHPSHYEQEVEGLVITVVKRSLKLPQKLAEACKNLDDYAREYKPARELTEQQKKEIESWKIERKRANEMFDAGFWQPMAIPTRYRINDGEKKI